jgi:O-Antigen ligase
MQTAIVAPLQARAAKSRISLRGLSAWALSFALVAYLGANGGGYDSVIRNQVGVAVWWIVLAGSIIGALSLTRTTRSGLVALALLAGFTVWTAIGVGWSNSVDSSEIELARTATYSGVLSLALMAITADIRREVVGGLAAGVVLVAALAVLSRLHPAWFSTDATAQFLPGSRGRLSYPINYWNGLAALLGVGVPLVMLSASAGRSLITQGLSSASLPLMALAGYLTFSRGGAVAACVGLVVFFLLTPARLPKLATLLVAGAGSAVLIGAATQRRAVEDGLVGHLATHQGNTLLAMTIVVCAGVGLLQVAIGLIRRHTAQPRWLLTARRRGWIAVAAAVLVGVVVAVAAGVPGHLSHTWHQFTQRTNDSADVNRLGRFTDVNGHGRYQLWQAAVHANQTHPWRGIGPGTFQYYWAQHRTINLFVRDAHSLYLQTLAELGIIGLVLVGGFVLWVLGAGATRAVRAGPMSGATLAAATAACAAFAVSAGYEWVWQIGVLPMIVCVLAAVIFARAPGSDRARRALRWGSRIGVAIVALAAVAVIGIPLAATTALRRSQNEGESQNFAAALTSARTAQRLQPDAGGPWLQEALVYEAERNFSAAAAAATRATSNEPVNWRNWLVLSRIEAERGRPAAAAAAYGRVSSLNPKFSLERQ